MDDGSCRSLCGSKWTKVVPQLKRKCETFAQKSSLYMCIQYDIVLVCVRVCVLSRRVYFGVLCCLDLVIVAQTSRADATIVCDFKAFDLSRAATISHGFIIYHPSYITLEKWEGFQFISIVVNSQFTSYDSQLITILLTYV